VKIAMQSQPNIPLVLDFPSDQDGELVFAEPWEARIFAIVVALHAAGKFEWSEFQVLLISQIEAAEIMHRCEPYYHHWFEAAEVLFERLGIVQHDEIDTVVDHLRPDDRTVRMRAEPHIR
jgi:nitrile hydratase accessory protein